MPHIAIVARCLLQDLRTAEFCIRSEDLWYDEPLLLSAGEGPVAVPLDWVLVNNEPLDLTSSLPDDVAKSVIAYVTHSPDRLMQQIASQPDPDAFLAAVAHPALCEALARVWRDQRQYWL